MKALPRIALLAALVAASACPAPARAADPTPTPTPPDVEARARTLYEQGMRHYNLNEHDAAIASFKEGYKLSGSPGFLYDIAQAYRLKGDCAQALSFYRNFLRTDPQTENRAAVQKRIADMEKCAQATAPPPVAVPPPPAAPPRGGGLRVTGLVIAGVGLAAAGTSIYFGIDARRASDDVSALYRAGATWDQAARDVEARGRRSQTLMLSLSVAGGAAAVAGALLFYFGWRAGRAEGPARVALWPTPRGAVMAWSGGF